MRMESGFINLGDMMLLSHFGEVLRLVFHKICLKILLYEKFLGKTPLREKFLKTLSYRKFV
jgi:hypothetical protein